jgi:hypothetical protein
MERNGTCLATLILTASDVKVATIHGYRLMQTRSAISGLHTDAQTGSLSHIHYANVVLRLCAGGVNVCVMRGNVAVTCAAFRLYLLQFLF